MFFKQCPALGKQGGLWECPVQKGWEGSERAQTEEESGWPRPPGCPLFLCGQPWAGRRAPGDLRPACPPRPDLCLQGCWLSTAVRGTAGAWGPAVGQS